MKSNQIEFESFNATIFVIIFGPSSLDLTNDRPISWMASESEQHPKSWRFKIVTNWFFLNQHFLRQSENLSCQKFLMNEDQQYIGTSRFSNSDEIWKSSRFLELYSWTWFFEINPEQSILILGTRKYFLFFKNFKEKILHLKWYHLVWKYTVFELN